MLSTYSMPGDIDTSLKLSCMSQLGMKQQNDEFKCYNLSSIRHKDHFTCIYLLQDSIENVEKVEWLCIIIISRRKIMQIAKTTCIPSAASLISHSVSRVIIWHAWMIICYKASVLIRGIPVHRDSTERHCSLPFWVLCGSIHHNGVSCKMCIVPYGLIARARYLGDGGHEYDGMVRPRASDKMRG